VHRNNLLHAHDAGVSIDGDFGELHTVAVAFADTTATCGTEMGDSPAAGYKPAQAAPLNAFSGAGFCDNSISELDVRTIGVAPLGARHRFQVLDDLLDGVFQCGSHRTTNHRAAGAGSIRIGAVPDPRIDAVTGNAKSMRHKIRDD